MVHPSPQGKRHFLRILQLAQMGVALGAEHLVEMAEAGQGRHQLYPPLGAVPIQLQYFSCGQRRIIPPDFTEITEQEGMLNIQLKLVHFIIRHFIGHFFQEGQLWHPSSGNVMVKPSVGDVRLVLNGDGRKHGSALRSHLQQGLAAVPYAGLPSCNTHIFFIHSEPVALRRHLLRLRQNHIARTARPPGQRRGKAQLLLQRLHSQLCLGGQLFAAGRLQHHIASIGQRKMAARFSKFDVFGLRYQIHVPSPFARIIYVLFSESFVNAAKPQGHSSLYFVIVHPVTSNYIFPSAKECRIPSACLPDGPDKPPGGPGSAPALPRA